MFTRQRKSALLPLGAGLVAALGPALHAQMHHVDAPERVTRAIGVYEWTGDLTKPTAARFVPVSLFVDGHFEDAGLYLARPVPFAIQTGDVYALEHAGEPEGLLDVDYAKRVVTGNALADDNPVGAWYAFGKFTPETAPKTPALHPSSHLPTLHASAGPNTPPGTRLPAASDDDSRPHMTRRDSSTQTTSTTPATSQPGSTPQTSTGTASTSSPSTSNSTKDDDDVDRPTLRRRDPSQDAARRREYGKKGSTASVTAAGPALGDDPDRPILGRSAKDDEGTPELTGLPTDMHQAVAVSDATHRDDHPFARDWDSPGERADTLAAMEALARPRIAAYLSANNLVPSSAPLSSATPGLASAPVLAAAGAGSTEAGSPPRLERGVPKQYQPASSNTNQQAPAPSASAVKSTTAAKTTASGKSNVTGRHRSRAAAKPTQHPAPLTLGQETLSGFTLSYGGLPTFVYTAAASAAPAKAPALPVPGANPVVYVTVVAQRLPSGNLQVALGAVTDSAHLDRSPHLRLIDAVDPDDSHRASLLFELRGKSSRQFALYRLTSAQAEQTFTTASIE